MKQKVVFLFGGTPHYLVKVLNRIHEKYAVTTIVPAASFKTLGSGVHQTDQGILYEQIRLPEVKTWYRKAGFLNIKKTLKELSPDFVVLGWPYSLMFLLYPGLLWYARKNKIELIIREIPFTVPAWNESFSEFKKTAVEAQKNERLFTSPLIFFLHKLVWKMMYRWVYKTAMCYTDDGKRILGSYGMRKDRIHTVYNSPDTDDLWEAIKALEPENLVRKKNRIIHVGRLVFWKRVDLLIRAVNVLKDEFTDIELIIIGKGEEENNLKAMVADLNLHEFVKFVGATYDEKDLCRYFQTSDLYVLAGMGGLSINEAMANGLPVICSVCDGTEKHLVFEGVNGCYFLHDDLASLIEKIRYVLSDEALKTSMGKASLEIIRDKVNIDVVIERMTRALSDSTNSTKGSAAQ